MYASASRSFLLLSCSATLAWGLAPPAWADVIGLSASATYSLDGGGPTSISQSTPTTAFPNIFPSANSGTTTSSVFGHDYSSQPNGQYAFGTRSSGNGAYSINGTSIYMQSFTQSPSVGGLYVFNFTIDAGNLSVSLPVGSTGQQSAGVTAVITETLNGGTSKTLFNYSASFALTTGGALPSFSETGAKLNPGGPTLAAGSGNYSWSPYVSNVSLGTLSPGDQVAINYTLTSFAAGTTTTCGSGGTVTAAVAKPLIARAFAAIGIGIGGGTSGCSAVARIGDPPNIAGGLPTNLQAPSVQPVAVPEPGTLALMTVGLGLLPFRRRRA